MIGSWEALVATANDALCHDEVDRAEGVGTYSRSSSQPRLTDDPAMRY